MLSIACFIINLHDNNLDLNRKILFTIFIFFNLLMTSQEIEKAIDSKNKTLTLMDAFIKSTYEGNTITDFSDSDIDTKKVGKYTLILKILKHKNFKENRQYLIDQLFSNDTIIFDKKSRKFKDTPANNIIKKVVKNRKNYFKKTNFYSADYYSKYLYKIKNAPKKIIGIELGDLGGGLDKTRSGIIYLSETFSEFIKKKKQFKEEIKAVKINGIDNKIGYNRASNNNFNFYKNSITIGDKIISPIAKSSLIYYKYKLEETFNKDSFTIFKIKVIPRRKTSNVFNGYIYIIKDLWQIYKVDLYVKGRQIQQPNIDFIKINQEYSLNKKENLWLLKNQTTTFKISQFNVNLNGYMVSEFSNYNFNKKSLKKQLNKKILFVANDATNKNESYWNKKRPTPLSKAEVHEYNYKNKIYLKRTSKQYFDSINRKQNKFYTSDLIFDYNHRNLNKKNRFKIVFPLNTMFNTIQGWHTRTSFSYFKDRKHQNYSLNTEIDYGFSDQQIRAVGSFNYRFNDKVNSILKFKTGKQLTEFNYPYSTAPIFNTFSNLIFKKNDAKFYDRYFAEISYHQELINGLFISSKISYENRKPVYNTTNYVLLNWKNKVYSSNNPLELNNYNTPIIDKHKLYKFKINATIKFGQKFLLLPNKKVNLSTNYPKLNLGYSKGFTFKNKNHNYDFIEARIFQHFNISNKGMFSYNIKGGEFIYKNNLSFIDYKHFDITQVHVSYVKDYTNHFAILPTYAFSTNNKFTEFHLEHDFNGYIFKKIPFINKLQYKLIIGANTLFTSNNKPYSEINIGLNNLGFGKYRFLRVDYVRSFFNGKSVGSFIFGLSL